MKMAGPRLLYLGVVKDDDVDLLPRIPYIRYVLQEQSKMKWR